MTPTTYRDSSETGLSRLEDDRRGLNEKGEKKSDNAYTKVYPENSFDVYGDEDNADSTCIHALRKNDALTSHISSQIQNDGMVESCSSHARRDSLTWGAYLALLSLSPISSTAKGPLPPVCLCKPRYGRRNNLSNWVGYHSHNNWLRHRLVQITVSARA